LKRDSIYYQLFKRFPALLFAIVDSPPAQASRYRFESIEVKETAFRIDSVFLPPPEPKPRVIFFAEVQLQKDELLYHRFFSEALIYLYRNVGQYEDWRGVLIFRSRRLDPLDQITHRSLLSSNQITRIYLDEIRQHSPSTHRNWLTKTGDCPQNQNGPTGQRHNRAGSTRDNAAS
jgi:predicted transposase/invertase (TIGR01784 family)